MRIIIILMLLFPMFNTSCLSRNKEDRQTELNKIIDEELVDLDDSENVVGGDFDPELDILDNEGKDPFAEFGELGKAEPIEEPEDVAASLKDLENFEDNTEDNLQEPGEIADPDAPLDVAQGGDVSSSELTEDVNQQENFEDFNDVAGSEEIVTPQDAPVDITPGEEPPISDGFVDAEPTSPPVISDMENQTDTLSRTEILGLDYRGNQNGGTIVVRANGPLGYATRSNDNGSQVIVEIPNTVLPKKFQRPYITKDFAGTIGMFRAYQESGSSTTRIVVQLKEPISPTVVSEGNQLLVMALGQQGMSVADQSDQNIPEESGIETVPEIEVATESEELAQGELEGERSKNQDYKALSNKTLDEFLTGESSKFYGHRISIEVKNTDIREIFNFIAEQSGLNLVLSDSVTGNLSLKLRDVPWDQALVVVMQSKSLGYIRQGNILRIAPLNMIREETQAMKSVVDAQKQLAPLFLKIFPISYAKAPALMNQVSQFITPKRGSIRADQRTNSLIVSDILENINRIGKLIKQLDTETPQVLIEGKIVEARETAARSIGIDWSGGGESGGTGGTSGIGGGTNTGGGNTGGNNTGEIGAGGDLIAFQSAVGDILNVSVGGSGGSLGVKVGTIAARQPLVAQLNLLESQDLINVLSSPRIMTLNNNQATITQETQLPIPKIVTSEGSVQSSVEFKSVSLNLSVTPQITIDGGIIMKVSVKREFPGASVTVGNTTASPINSRSADTTVLVNNGDTTVIGGIYESDVTKGETGVPLLGKIPILGYFFKNTSYGKSKTELLIFLTPRVLNQERAFISSTEELGLESEVSEDSDTL